MLFCTLALTGAGVAIGLKRKPVYTAKSDLNVGRLDIQTQAVPGFAQAAQNLASAYARIAESDPVVTRAARSLGVRPSVVRDRLTTTAVPQSTVVRLEAEGGSKRAALRVNGAVTDATLATINRLNRTPASQNRLLDQYRAKLRELGRARRRSGPLERQLRRARGRRAIAIRSRLRALQVEIAAVRLEVEGTRGAYFAARDRAVSGPGTQILTRAASASSDRISYLQRLGFAGLVAGLAVGIALAVLRARRLRRRPGAVAAR